MRRSLQVVSDGDAGAEPGAVVVEAGHTVAAGVAVVRARRGPVHVADSAVAERAQSPASHRELVVDLPPNQLGVLPHVDSHSFHVPFVGLCLFLTIYILMKGLQT